MNTQELRLGNLVIADDEKTYKVSSISEYKITVDDEVLSGWWMLDEIHPIPLTEEWLRKFGFNKWEENTDGAIWGIIIGYDVCEDLKIVQWYKGERRFERRYLSIKSVHQLQNLFFALTGNELTIKE